MAITAMSLSMPSSSPGGVKAPDSSCSWYCIHTQSKREHIAAGLLECQLRIDTFLPRIKFRRKERHRVALAIEALFPNYLFARFDLSTALQRVQCVPGVIGVVRFGAHCPTIPEQVINSLRAQVGDERVHFIGQELQPGEWVDIATGPFEGLQAVVARELPARDRVKVLIELLGRQTIVELAANAVAATTDVRRKLFESREG
jgi:transcriptional antiterminator RfaH